jgi:NAD(P)-dependent dehydrogenase (short-subunit alcohol dehydrogenase family)
MGLLDSKVALITGAGSGNGQGIAKRFAEEGARVVIDYNIAPGAIQTPINKKLMADKGEMQALLKNIPLNRLGVPEDVANLAAFLASNKAG